MIQDSYKKKAKLTTEVLNSMEGVKCNEVQGAMYAFPRITIPQRAIEEAKVTVLPPLMRKQMRKSAHETIKTPLFTISSNLLHVNRVKLFFSKYNITYIVTSILLNRMIAPANVVSSLLTHDVFHFAGVLYLLTKNPTDTFARIFPSLDISPLMALFSFKVQGIPPDEFYCWRVLEKTGSYIVPGRAFDMNGSGNHYYFP